VADPPRAPAALAALAAIAAPAVAPATLAALEVASAGEASMANEATRSTRVRAPSIKVVMNAMNAETAAAQAAKREAHKRPLAGGSDAPAGKRLQTIQTKPMPPKKSAATNPPVTKKAPERAQVCPKTGHVANGGCPKCRHSWYGCGGCNESF
jgi:hypothetical protein